MTRGRQRHGSEARASRDNGADSRKSHHLVIPSHVGWSLLPLLLLLLLHGISLSPFPRTPLPLHGHLCALQAGILHHDVAAGVGSVRCGQRVRLRRLGRKLLEGHIYDIQVRQEAIANLLFRQSWRRLRGTASNSVRSGVGVGVRVDMVWMWWARGVPA